MYNEAYKNEVAGNKHPELMGTGFSGPFSELWDHAGPIFRECARTGKSVRMENDRLPIERCVLRFPCGRNLPLIVLHIGDANTISDTGI